MKKKWSVLRNIIGKQKFVINDYPGTNQSHIPMAFNDYFSKIVLETSKMCHRLVPNILITGRTRFHIECLSTQ